MRTINIRGIELIKAFEKCKLKSYHGAADAPGIYTIGWGHVITGHEQHTHGFDLFRPGQMMRDVAITQQIADDLLKLDIEKTIKVLTMKIKKEQLETLNEDQFAALVSIVYNVGVGAFVRQSTFMKLLAAGASMEKIANLGFKGWVYAGGRPVNGLIIRRAAEKALFLGDYGPMQQFMERRTNLVTTAKRYLGRR